MQDELKQERAYRVLFMYDILQRGGGFAKKSLAQKFNVSEKSIQRDIELLNQYISDELDNFSAEKNIVYKKQSRQHVWRNRNDILLNDGEITLVATILLATRSLPRNNIKQLLDKLLAQCSEEQRRRIEQLIQNELHHYLPVKHGKYLGNIILAISQAKQNQQLMNIWYQKVGSAKAEKLCIKPLGVMFSEYYFYLLAYNDGEEMTKPIAYRIDRIERYEVRTEHFNVIYAEKFEEGEFRKQVQFMNTGKLFEVKFRFWGKSLEAILDRLPNAKIIKQDDREAIVTAKIFGKGIKMWFLSQAEFLEVLEPEEFRAEMAKSIRMMLGNYKDC